MEEDACLRRSMGFVHDSPFLAGTHEKKVLQNRWYKRWGGAAAVLGIAGFLPSLYHLCRGVVWSVSHDAPHTEVDSFLKVHAASMCVWFVALAVQIPTGGTSYKAVHRWVGYVGVSGLGVGMLTSTAWVFKFDVAKGDVAGAAYTLLLIVCSSVNMILAVHHVRQRHTSEHKDHALMALMWSLDPAIHRFIMWLVRWAMAPAIPDARKLLMYGKLPANALLVLCFGLMAVGAKRLNAVMKVNIGLQFLLFFISLAMLLLDAAGLGSPPRPCAAVWGSAVAGAIVMLAATCALWQVAHRREAVELHEHTTTR